MSHFLQEGSLEGVPVLVLANKADIAPPGCVGQMIFDMGLHERLHNRAWNICSVAAKDVEGSGDLSPLEWATSVDRGAVGCHSFVEDQLTKAAK
mmetsp:Transcript_22325/g.52887  ORF Transcript_22325/g.52887 Transcript_22325/m.52887 type:complete len:94 (-) Transcript_22325:22-303(-)